MAILPLFKQRLSGGNYEPFFTARGPKHSDTTADPECCLCCDCASVKKVKLVIQGWNSKGCYNPFCDDIYWEWMLDDSINGPYTTTDISALQFGNVCNIDAIFHLGDRQDDLDPEEEPDFAHSGVLMQDYYTGSGNDCLTFGNPGEQHQIYLYQISATMSCSICPATGKAILCGFIHGFACQHFMRTAERPFTEPEEELGELIYGLWEVVTLDVCGLPMSQYDDCMTETRSDPQVCASPVLPPVENSIGCDEIGASLLGACAGAHGSGTCFPTDCNWDTEDNWFRFDDVVTLLCVIAIDES